MKPIPILLALFTFCAPAIAGVTFRASFDSSVRGEPASGRLVIYVAHAATQPATRATTKPAPATQSLAHWDLLFGTDVSDLAPGAAAIVDNTALGFPSPLAKLAKGNYLAQAVLDMHHDDSNWRREPGNLFSNVVEFTVTDQDTIVTLPLANVIAPTKYATTQSAEVFEIPSKLLSDFHHRPMMLRAGVVFPRERDASRAYAAIYHIPGFGGNGIGIVANPSSEYEAGPAGDELAKNTFHIVLDPESGNGHDLCANSDNNGPVGDAIVQELIPALEKKYNLVASADGRIVKGHSSGGWAALWLALQYPETFGARFSASPDPVDFRHLEQIDIYAMENAYVNEGKALVGSRSKSAATVREENAAEEVLGPQNSSGHDWDAWQAVWGTRDSAGHVAALFDPVTGKINKAEAETWRRHDIADLLKTHPERYLPIFRERVRLVVGDQDNFFLNDAVASLKVELDALPASPGHGYVKILPGYTHGTISDAPEWKHWPAEMVEHLRGHGLLAGK